MPKRSLPTTNAPLELPTEPFSEEHRILTMHESRVVPSIASRRDIRFVSASSLLPALLLLAAHVGIAQTGLQASAETAKPAAPAASADRPLPGVSLLMLEVEARQRDAERARRDYIFHEVETDQELDGHGALKKTEVNEYDSFWLDGVPVRKQVKKNGRELTEEENRKESERIDKEVAKAKERREKEDAKGKQTDPRGNDEVTVSRLLELGSFTNPRRVQMNGRDTIEVDYTGDPKAKTRNSFEGVIRDMAGTVWVDEQDKALARIEGHFTNSFKIGGGLVANIQQGTNFAVQLLKINGEVWLPARIEGRGEARVLLFFKFNGNVTVVDSNYRKFKTSSTVLPVGAPVPDAPH